MEEKKFKLKSAYKPAGDQQQAIDKLVDGIVDGLKNQVLLGVTGSGKTFTMANIIEKTNRPTLVIAHNKTLAAQLCNEFREFFPENRVEYFVSYYDYYQPEAYIISTDTYIEKDMAINDEIDKLRASATASLLERSDTIVVASVSCIYGLGSPKEYLDLQICLHEGDKIKMKELIRRLIEINYERGDADFKRSTFRVKGDRLEVFPAYSSEIAVRIDFFGDTIESLSEFEAVTGRKITDITQTSIFPASHYAVGTQKLADALAKIEEDMTREVKAFEDSGKYIEAQRLKERTTYNLEMMREIGYCSGIENYSRYFDGREIGEAPYTLMDYFPKNYLTLIDESHMTIPQVRAMYNGDKARKTSLVDYGFRLQSAFDNRPLKFAEFNKKLGQTIYISATPADYEKGISDQTAEQIIRPTGLLDPEIKVYPTENQIEVLLDEINYTTQSSGRTLVTTLTKKMAESLTAYLSEHKIRARYMHSEIDTMERIDIINSLRRGDFDVLVGINLLREGLDLPEVKLVAILDADKEGFLRSEGALIQTIGRAARNSEGHVVMFADVMTKSMQRAIGETNRRREIQNKFNKDHNITPKTIIKDIKNTLEISKKAINTKGGDISQKIEKLKALMNIAVKQLDFELAIKLRDEIAELKRYSGDKNGK